MEGFWCVGYLSRRGVKLGSVCVLATWAFESSEVDGAVGFGHGGLEHVLGLLRELVAAKI